MICQRLCDLWVIRLDRLKLQVFREEGQVPTSILVTGTVGRHLEIHLLLSDVSGRSLEVAHFTLPFIIAYVPLVDSDG
jgi:hypothetical protein